MIVKNFSYQWGNGTKFDILLAGFAFIPGAGDLNKALWKSGKYAGGIIEYVLKNVNSISEKIANGHALTNHLSEFQHLNILNATALNAHIKDIINKTSGTQFSKELHRGRVVFIDVSSDTLVFYDPNNIDLGTAFVHNPQITGYPSALEYFNSQN